MPGTQIEPRPDHLPVPVPGLPVRKRESEALPARMIRGARRNRHVTVPAAVPVAAWSAAEIMHAFGMGGYWGIAGLVLTGSVWFFAPHKWTDKNGDPRWPEVWYARLTAAAFSLWLWAAASIGAAAGTPGEILAALLIVLSIAWGVPWYRHHRVRGRKDRANLLREWQAFWAGHSHAWGVGGSNVIEAEEKHAQVRIRVQLIGGRQSWQSVKGSVHLIESALGAYSGIGMVRVQPVKSNPSQVDIFMKRDNPLRDLVEWDESLAPSSILDDWYPGMDETGKWRRVAQLESLFAIGATGTGKSTLLLAGILARCGCRDVVSVLIDLKGGRSGRPVLETGAADYVITTVPEAEMFLLMCEAEIDARMEEAYDGHEQLAPTESTPAVVTDIDETRKLTSVAKGTARAADSLATMATTGRSANFRPRVYTQYGSLDSSVRVNETRMNLRQRFLFRVEDAGEGAFAIPEYSQLDATVLEEPGTCFAKDREETPSEQLRIVNVTHDVFRELAPARIAKRGPKPALKLWCGNRPCPAGGTWQQWWDSRWSRLPQAFREISVQYQEWAEKNDVAGEAPAAPPAGASPLSRPYLAPAPPLPEDDEDEDGAAAAARIMAETEGDDIAPSPGAAARVAEIREAQRARFFALFAGAGPGGIQMTALIEQSGVGQTWAYDTMGRLLPRGAVAKVRQGVWAPVPGRDARSEAAAVKAGDDLLAGTARKELERVG